MKMRPRIYYTETEGARRYFKRLGACSFRYFSVVTRISLLCIVNAPSYFFPISHYSDCQAVLSLKGCESVTGRSLSKVASFWRSAYRKSAVQDFKENGIWPTFSTKINLVTPAVACSWSASYLFQLIRGRRHYPVDRLQASGCHHQSPGVIPVLP